MLQFVTFIKSFWYRITSSCGANPPYKYPCPDPLSRIPGNRGAQSADKEYQYQTFPVLWFWQHLIFQIRKRVFTPAGPANYTHVASFSVLFKVRFYVHRFAVQRRVCVCTCSALYCGLLLMKWVQVKYLNAIITY